MALVIVIDFARRRLLLPCTWYCKRYGTQQQQSPLLGDPKKKKEAPLSLPHARQALHLSGYVIINCGLLKILWPPQPSTEEWLLLLLLLVLGRCTFSAKRILFGQHCVVVVGLVTFL